MLFSVGSSIHCFSLNVPKNLRARKAYISASVATKGLTVTKKSEVKYPFTSIISVKSKISARNALEESSPTMQINASNICFKK